MPAKQNLRTVLQKMYHIIYRYGSWEVKSNLESFVKMKKYDLQNYNKNQDGFITNGAAFWDLSLASGNFVLATLQYFDWRSAPK